MIHRQYLTRFDFFRGKAKPGVDVIEKNGKTAVEGSGDLNSITTQFYPSKNCYVFTWAF
jgi:hypothetical protein